MMISADQSHQETSGIETPRNEVSHAHVGDFFLFGIVRLQGALLYAVRPNSIVKGLVFLCRRNFDALWIDSMEQVAVRKTVRHFSYAKKPLVVWRSMKLIVERRNALQWRNLSSLGRILD